MSFDLKIINGDFSVSNGDVDTVVDTEKLTQDLLKICLTENGSNPLHPWYGSFLSRTIVGSVLNPNMTMQLARVQLENSVKNLQILQENQVRTFQTVSPQEQISAILDILITRNPQDFRFYAVNVRVLNKAFQTATASFTVNTI
jgi:uncharacterized membrane protein